MMMVEDYSFEEGFMTDGSVVIFPTDTVYGLAARLYDNDAQKKIEAIKANGSIKYAVLCDTRILLTILAIIDERAKKEVDGCILARRPDIDFEKFENAL